MALISSQHDMSICYAVYVQLGNVRLECIYSKLEWIHSRLEWIHSSLEWNHSKVEKANFWLSGLFGYFPLPKIQEHMWEEECERIIPQIQVEPGLKCNNVFSTKLVWNELIPS